MDALNTGKECKITLVNSPSPLQSAEIIGFKDESVRHGHAIIFTRHHNYSGINSNTRGGGEVIAKCFRQTLNDGTGQYILSKSSPGI